MSEKTIFKRILDGEIPADIVYQDADCVAFRDVNPMAPVHILVIPRKEIVSVDDLQPEDAALVGRLFLVIRKIAAQQGLAKGYRIVTNCGPDAGQTVAHLHFHLVGGRPLSWTF
ncbi:MAG: histidine triad nucleotide-binding protein [Thermoguttaceae bacterium]|nr:histidine triad nucleotide-binding protein [Thermoguttaceae bacterium]